jgi:hypothetical protein
MAYNMNDLKILAKNGCSNRFERQVIADGTYLGAYSATFTNMLFK